MCVLLAFAENIRKGENLCQKIAQSSFCAATQTSTALFESRVATVKLFYAAYNYTAGKDRYIHDFNEAGAYYVSSAERILWSTAYSGVAVLYTFAGAAYAATGTLRVTAEVFINFHNYMFAKHKPNIQVG